MSVASLLPAASGGVQGIEAKGGTADYCWLVWPDRELRALGPLGPFTVTQWIA